MTLATRIVFLILTFSSAFSHAADEYWEIIQVKKSLSGSNFLLVEYVERDFENFFQSKNLNLIRISYGGRIGAFKYLIGGAYVDFESSSDERRAHQFLLYNYNLASAADFFVRMGLEERSFISDDNLYLRGRLRIQVNPLPEYPFGVALYDEIFYVPDGFNKFANGFNENRLGIGLRYITKPVELYVYHTEADLKGFRGLRHLRWIQLQAVFNF